MDVKEADRLKQALEKELKALIKKLRHARGRERQQLLAESVHLSKLLEALRSGRLPE